MSSDGKAFLVVVAMVFATLIAIVVCLTVVRMTPQSRCADACGYRSVVRITPSECVCEER
jgi:competence protein ComGC